MLTCKLACITLSSILHVHTFGLSAVLKTYSHKKLASTNHHFLRNQDDCSSDQNLQIRHKEYSRSAEEMGFS